MRTSSWVVFGLSAVLLVVVSVLLGIYVPKTKWTIKSKHNIAAGTYLTSTAKYNAVKPDTVAMRTPTTFLNTFQQTPCTLSETGYVLENVNCAQDVKGTLHMLFHFNKVNSQGIVTESAVSRKIWNTNSLQDELTLVSIQPGRLLIDMASLSLEVCTANNNIVSLFSDKLTLRQTITLVAAVKYLKFESELFVLALDVNNTVWRIDTTTNSVTTLFSDVKMFNIVGNTFTSILSTGDVKVYNRRGNVYTLTNSIHKEVGEAKIAFSSVAGNVLVYDRNDQMYQHRLFAGKPITTEVFTSSSVYPFRYAAFAKGCDDVVLYTKGSSLYMNKLSHYEVPKIMLENMFELFTYQAQLAVGVHSREDENVAYVTVIYGRGSYTDRQTLQIYYIK